MAGGARVTTATTAGRSAARSMAARRNFKAKWTRAAFTSCSKTRSFRSITRSRMANLPLAWLQLMRESIRSVTPVFNTHRMVKEYAERLYTPAAQAHENFARDDCGAATSSANGKRRCARIGRKCRITDVQVGNADRQNIQVGETLAGFREGPSRRGRSGSRSGGGVSRRSRQRRGPESGGDGARESAGGRRGELPLPGFVPASDSGTYGFSVRVVPTHPHLMQTHELRLITWS